jgi:hypothetical protein
MHVYMQQQLVEDRVAELRADAERGPAPARTPAPSGPPRPISPWPGASGGSWSRP